MKQSIFLLLACLPLVAFNIDDKHCYVTVNASFQSSYDGYTKGASVLKTAMDTSGRILVSCNALNEFPELFETLGTYDVVWLSPAAFPQVRDSL